MKLKLIAACLVVLMLLATACGKSDTGQSSGQDQDKTAETNDTDKAPESGKDDPFGKYGEPITLSLGKSVSTKNTNLPNGDTVDNNEYYRFIEKKLNIKVSHEWQTETQDAYQQKLSVSIASQDLPDAFIVNEKQLKQLVEADLIADLTDVYDKYASQQIKNYYDSYGDRVLKRATFDGKLMAFPGTEIGGQHSITWIRQDWLDKLGLQPPKTLDELLAVAKAFTENDPDGNNKKDTYGFTGIPTLAGWNTVNGFDPIFGALHAYKGQWLKDQSGNAVYSSTLPEMKTALAKLHELYAAGIIDKEFPVRKDSAELIAGNKVGIVFGPWWIPYWPLPDSVKNDPKAEWKPYTAPLDADGKFNTYDQNPTGSFLVVNKEYAHPEAVAKVLNVEYQGIRKLDPESKDIYKDLNVSWTIWPFALQIDTEDAAYRSHLELKKAWDAKDASNERDEIKMWYENVKKNAENPKKDLAAWSDAMARMDGSAEIDPSKLTVIRNVFFGQTKTMELKWAILEKMENETFLKIILGEEPVDKFDSFVQEWKKLGGDEITKEVDEASKK